jgi:hypothetical protein
MIAGHSSRPAWTWVELAVCLFAVLVAAGILIPALFETRSRSHGPGGTRTQSTNNLKQFGIATQDCASALDGLIPPAVGNFSGKDGTFFFHILPYIEHENLWKAYNMQGVVRTYYNPLDLSHPGNKPWTSYAVNSAVFGVWPKDPARFPNVFGLKGSSQTIIVMERFAVAGGDVHAWADLTEGATYLDGPATFVEIGVKPEQARNDTAHAMTPSGCQVALADGSTRTISANISRETFRWVCDPKAEPAPPSDW